MVASIVSSAAGPSWKASRAITQFVAAVSSPLPLFVVEFRVGQVGVMLEFCLSFFFLVFFCLISLSWFATVGSGEGDEWTNAFAKQKADLILAGVRT